MADVGNVISAGASIFSGFEQRRAAKEASYAARYRADIMRIRATQAAADGQRDINQTLDAIASLRSGRGLSADSPTAAAIREGVRERGADAKNNAVLTQLLGMDAELNQARSLSRSANAFVIQGFANAATTLSDSFSFRDLLPFGG